MATEKLQLRKAVAQPTNQISHLRETEYFGAGK